MTFFIIIGIGLLLWLINSLVTKVNSLSQQINFFKIEVLEKLNQLNSATKVVENKTSNVIVEEKKPVEVVPIVLAEELKPSEPALVQEQIIEEITETPIAPKGETLEDIIKRIEASKKPIPEAPKTEVQEQTIRQAEPSFFEKNPDLEKFIGENLINKIGIAILVLGIGFFVKYAIDRDWINEIGRVFIGIICGGILIGIAHYLRKRFTSFSSVLVGGGLSVLYFTVAIAFHQYNIINQTVAFVVMVVITIFAVILSIAYDRKELAVLSILGGFSSPFMLSTGECNYVVLFSYLTILNSGMLALAYYKKWNIINVISYLFTILIFGSWLIAKVIPATNPPYAGALVFATVFYLIFFVMNIINNVKEKRSFSAAEISILLSNTFLYYSAGMKTLMHLHDGIYQGLFTLVIAAFNLVFVLSLYKNEKVDRNLIYLLIGLVLTFVSLAIPVQLEGNYITLFWAMESVLLLWLSQKSGIKLIAQASVLVMILMLVSLVIDWNNIYNLHDNNFLTVVANKGFITGVVALGAIVGNLFLMGRDVQNDKIVLDITKYDYSKALRLASVIVLYFVLFLELKYQVNQYVLDFSSRQIIMGVYNYLFVLCLLFLISKRSNKMQILPAIILGAISLLMYVLSYNGYVTAVRNNYIYDLSFGLSSFILHYISVFAALVILYLVYKMARQMVEIRSLYGKIIMWSAAFFLIFIASAELMHVSVLANAVNYLSITETVKHTNKIGFAILWGICSFVFMYIGMKRKIRDIRIISLALFLITLLKLFLFDIRNISEGGKIVAFISLGVILLIVSFMYQKLKSLILVEDNKEQV